MSLRSKSFLQPSQSDPSSRVALAAQRSRDDVLMIAQNFTAKDAKRDITTVMTIATPLMVWLDEAPNRTDREARMSALRRVDSGNIYTVSRATTPASEIIAMASVYYRFIVAQ